MITYKITKNVGETPYPTRKIRTGNTNKPQQNCGTLSILQQAQRNFGSKRGKGNSTLPHSVCPQGAPGRPCVFGLSSLIGRPGGGGVGERSAVSWQAGKEPPKNHLQRLRFFLRGTNKREEKGWVREFNSSQN